MSRVGDKRHFSEALPEDVEEHDADEISAQFDPSEADDEAPDVELSEEDILKLVEEAPEVPPLDLAGLRQYVHNLERAILKNQQMRAKFADDPKKFMDSELKLDESVKTLHELATQPSLYAEFVQMNGLALLLSLLAHENADIAGSAVVLVRDLTQADDQDDDEDEDEAAEDSGNGKNKAHQQVLLDALLTTQHLELLISNLDRLDESYPDDAQTVFNTLTVIENVCDQRASAGVLFACPWLADADADIATDASSSASSSLSEGKTSPLFAFLLKRIEPRKHDQNRLYASEILAILLGAAGDDRSRRVFGDMVGPSRLVRNLQAYVSESVRSAEEEEFCGNVFDALSSALLLSDNRPLLAADAAAMPTLIGLLRKGDVTRAPSLRVLDFAVTKCPECCAAFVDAGGLKTLFAVFMLNKKAKKTKDEAENDEHLISIISQLFSGLADDRYARLLNKFVESEFEKIDRLVALHDKYSRRLEESDARRQREIDQDGDEPESDSERYLRRLDDGLFTLQLTDLVLGFIATAGNEQIKDRVDLLLNQLDFSLDDIKKTLQEYASHVGAADAEDPQHAIITGIVGLL